MDSRRTMCVLRRMREYFPNFFCVLFGELLMFARMVTLIVADYLGFITK